MKSFLFNVAIVIVAIFCLMLIGDVFTYGFRLMLFGMKLTLLPVAVIALIYVVLHFLWIVKKRKGN